MESASHKFFLLAKSDDKDNVKTWAGWLLFVYWCMPGGVLAPVSEYARIDRYVFQ